MNFEIKDGNKIHYITYDPIPAMDWVFLTERLIGILSHCDDEIASLLRNATGLDSSEVKKDLEFTTKIIKGLLKAVSNLSDHEKIDVYNRIMKGFSIKTPEGGVVLLNCNNCNAIITKPTNFYLIIYNCLKLHYEDFFLEIKDRWNTLQNQEQTTIN